MQTYMSNDCHDSWKRRHESFSSLRNVRKRGTTMDDMDLTSVPRSGMSGRLQEHWPRVPSISALYEQKGSLPKLLPVCSIHLGRDVGFLSLRSAGSEVTV